MGWVSANTMPTTKHCPAYAHQSILVLHQRGFGCRSDLRSPPTPRRSQTPKTIPIRRRTVTQNRHTSRRPSKTTVPHRFDMLRWRPHKILRAQGGRSAAEKGRARKRKSADVRHCVAFFGVFSDWPISPDFRSRSFLRLRLDAARVRVCAARTQNELRVWATPLALAAG